MLRHPDTEFAETRTINGDRADDPHACSALSPRECGVLELIGQGYSNKSVARALGITAETVKSHIKHVFIKLGVSTRAHAVARAQRLGLFGEDSVSV